MIVILGEGETDALVFHEISKTLHLPAGIILFPSIFSNLDHFLGDATKKLQNKTQWSHHDLMIIANGGKPNLMKYSMRILQTMVKNSRERCLLIITRDQDSTGTRIKNTILSNMTQQIRAFLLNNNKFQAPPAIDTPSESRITVGAKASRIDVSITVMSRNVEDKIASIVNEKQDLRMNIHDGNIHDVLKSMMEMLGKKHVRELIESAGPVLARDHDIVECFDCINSFMSATRRS